MHAPYGRRSHVVARTYIVQPATGNARCSLKDGVHSVSGWAGAHPGNLCMRSARASGSHAILRSATKPAEPHIAGTRAHGRQLVCWKPLTRASDHALKLPRPSQPAAPGSAVVSRIMTTGGCSARSAAKRRCLGAQLIVHPIRHERIYDNN